MIQGLLYNHILETYSTVTFDSPTEVFDNQPFTIIGASIENNLVILGLECRDHLPIANIKTEIMNQFVFDDPPRGNVLFLLTDDNGIPVSIDSITHLEGIKKSKINMSL